MEGIFHLKAEEYVRDLDFLSAHKEDIALGLNRVTLQPLEVCREYVAKEMRPGGRLGYTDPKTILVTKDENEDRQYTTTTFLAYIKNIEKQGLIVAPNMSVYAPKTREVAFTTVYLDQGIKNRSKNKKAAFRAEELGDMSLYEFKWNQQSVDKILNNGLSGAQCNEHTILFCPTIHSALTSICRSAASYGNSNNERILSGNRHYWSADIVEANMLATARLMDRELVNQAMVTFGLYWPTGDDIVAMVERSSQYYWRNVDRLEDIRVLANGLEPIERAAILYTSDLYYIAKHNYTFMYSLLDRMSSIEKITPRPDIVEALSGMTDDMEVLTAYLCADYIRGSKLKSYKEFSDDVQYTIASTATNVKETVQDYAVFFKAFFCSKIMPHSIANVPTMIRHVSVLSDTDSAVYTVQEWIEWFYGKISFEQKPTNVGHCVSYITSTSIIHILATMSKNMGVATEELFVYAMKSEYYFPVFGLTSRAKTYYASKRGQEGLIFEKDKREIKGSVFKGSNAPVDVMNDFFDRLDFILDEVGVGKKISILKQINEITALEEEVIRRIKSGDKEIFSEIEVKEEKSYKLDRYRSNYFHYLLWERVFAPKYGSVQPPPYRGVRLGLNTETNAKLGRWLDSLEDQELAERMRLLLLEADKSAGLGSLIMPLSMIETHGVPIEIEQALDIRGIVGGLMEQHYVLLESLGHYMLEGNQERLLSDG